MIEDHGARARIPVKLHRRVCLVQTEDAVLAEELLAHKKLAQDIVGRLTDRVLLVRPGRVDAVVQELRRWDIRRRCWDRGQGSGVRGQGFATGGCVAFYTNPLPLTLTPLFWGTPLGTERWNQHIRTTLKRYDEALLRQVAHKLCKPRNQWPVDELLDRVVATFNNAAMIDRRLKELPAACRQILAVIGQSRQTRWPVGALVECWSRWATRTAWRRSSRCWSRGCSCRNCCRSVPSRRKKKSRPGRACANFESWLGALRPDADAAGVAGRDDARS